MTGQDTLARHDTVTGPSAAMDQRSPVCTDAIWRLPVTVCRITQFLGEQTAGALLERAIASAGDTLKPSMIRDREVVPDFRRSRSCQEFAASELMAAIDEVLEAVEHTLGVSCQHTEPSYSLNVHNDGDFYRPHQDTSAEFAPPASAHVRVLPAPHTPAFRRWRAACVRRRPAATHRHSWKVGGAHLAGLGARARQHRVLPTHRLA
jgi:hypothetical protein